MPIFTATGASRGSVRCELYRSRPPSWSAAGDDRGIAPPLGNFLFPTVGCCNCAVGTCLRYSHVDVTSLHPRCSPLQEILLVEFRKQLEEATGGPLKPMFGELVSLLLPSAGHCPTATSASA